MGALQNDTNWYSKHLLLLPSTGEKLCLCVHWKGRPSPPTYALSNIWPYSISLIYACSGVYSQVPQRMCWLYLLYLLSIHFLPIPFIIAEKMSLSLHQQAHYLLSKVAAVTQAILLTEISPSLPFSPFASRFLSLAVLIGVNYFTSTVKNQACPSSSTSPKQPSMSTFFRVEGDTT